jgi:hypothetical protein
MEWNEGHDLCHVVPNADCDRFVERAETLPHFGEGVSGPCQLSRGQPVPNLIKTHIHMYAYTHTYANTHTHIYIHIYTHIHDKKDE